MPVGKNIIISVVSVCYGGIAQCILQELDIFSCFTEKIIRETGKKNCNCLSAKRSTWVGVGPGVKINGVYCSRFCSRDVFLISWLGAWMHF